MSRTISAIYDELISEKESNLTLTDLSPSAGENATNLLSELTSQSKVAFWRLIFWIVAGGIWALENIVDLAKLEMIEIGKTLITGTARWYRLKCFEYQHGDVLIWNTTTNRFDYATVNDTIKIVKRASVIDMTGLLNIKVAKLSGGLPVPLSSPELVSFTYYINLIKFAGTNVNVISLVADQLRIELTVKINPLILLSNGESIAVPGSFPVELAVNSYIQQLPFDGIFQLTELVDTIQRVSGVINPVVTLSTARPFGGVHAPVDPVFGYNASAGHMVVDPSFPLNTSIIYV